MDILEGTCGYGKDGNLGETPAGPHLLDDDDLHSKLSRGHKPDYYQLGTSEFKPFDKSRDEDIEENYKDGKKKGKSMVVKKERCITGVLIWKEVKND